MFSSKITYIYLVFWGALISVCAYLSPYFANDYRYMLIFGTSDKVTNVFDIFVSQYHHYFNWGGRTIAHLIAQHLLFAPKAIQALLQGLLYCMMLVLICYMGNMYSKIRLSHIFTVSIMLFLSLRYFGEVTISPVSASNYLYTSLIILIFLIPFVQSFDNRRPKSKAFAFMMLLLGVISGWCNENTGFALCFVIGLICLYRIYKKDLRAYELCGLIGVILGFALLVFAPGNGVRYENIKQAGFEPIAHFFATFKIIGVSIIAMYALFIPLIYLSFKAKLNLRKMTIDNDLKKVLFILALGFSSFFIMMFSPTFPARATSFCSFCISIAIVQILVYMKKQKINVLPSSFKRILIIASGTYVLVISSNMVYGYHQAYLDGIERDNYIKEQIAQGNLDIVTSAMHVTNTKYLYIADIRANTKHYANVLVANYYKINSIKRQCDVKKRFLNNDFILIASTKHRVCESNLFEQGKSRDF